MAVHGLLMMRKWSRVAPRKYSFLLWYTLKVFKWQVCTMRRSKSKSLVTKFLTRCKAIALKLVSDWGGERKHCHKVNHHVAVCSFCGRSLKEDGHSLKVENLPLANIISEAVFSRCCFYGKTLQSTSQFHSAAFYCSCTLAGFLYFCSNF